MQINVATGMVVAGMKGVAGRIGAVAGLVLLPLVAILALSTPTAAVGDITMGEDIPISGEKGEPEAVEQGDEAMAAQDACPPLIRIKYPWLTCSTNAWGGKTIDSTGREPAARLLLTNVEPVENDALWGADINLLK